MGYLGTKRAEFEYTLYREEEGEEEVEVTKDVHKKHWGVLKLHHEEQGVQDDQEQDEVLEGGGGDQPPYMVPAQLFVSWENIIFVFVQGTGVYNVTRGGNCLCSNFWSLKKYVGCTLYLSTL